MLTHDDLVQRAARWLRSRFRCSIVLADMRTMRTDEQPDAIGWQGGWGWSVLVECKTSRSDFLRDRRKPSRNGAQAMGQERWYFAPEGVLDAAEMPEGWGLAEVDAGGKVRIRAKASPGLLADRAGCAMSAEVSRAEVPFLLAALSKVQTGYTHRLRAAMGLAEVVT